MKFLNQDGHPKCSKKGLDLSPAQLGLELDALFCMEVNDVDELRRRLLGTYALYRVHNSLRHGALAPAEIEGAFLQFLREGRSAGVVRD